MRVELTLPARINLLGNPSDANEGDFATISAAISIHAGATLEPAEGLVVESKDSSRPIRLTFDQGAVPLSYDGRLDLCKGAVNRLYQVSEEFRTKFRERGVHITTWTDVPRTSGLGGSSLFVLLTLAGFREFYDLDRRVHSDYFLAELAQHVEAKELGITCGFADRYVPLFGGIAYIDYRGKLHQGDLGEEPYATYEPLDRWVETLPIILISSGLERDSGDVHGQMRPRYLEEYRGWSGDRAQKPPMVRFMEGAWKTAWQGKMALVAGDWARFGSLMSENHRLVDDMMVYCGFPEGAGGVGNVLIDRALQGGALGAKLTGAGGGGCVFALTYPGEEARVIEVWQSAISELDLSSAQIYQPRIEKQGLVVKVT